MELGLSSWTYPWATGVPGYPQPPEPFTPRHLLRRARDLEVRLVQVADNLPLHELSPAELDAFGEEAREWGIAVEVGTAGLEPEHLLRYLGIATRLGSRLVRTVPRSPRGRLPLAEVEALLREIVPHFADAGVALALENYEHYRAGEFAELVRRVASPWLGVCLDTVNSLGALETPEAVVEKLARYVNNLHVKDFTISRLDHKMGYLVAGSPAGEGMLDIPWILDQIRDAGKDPSVVLEDWPPFAESVEASVHQEEEWAIRSVRNLKRLLAQNRDDRQSREP